MRHTGSAFTAMRFLLGILMPVLVAVPAGARTLFAGKKVLTPDKTVDLTLWLFDTTASPDDAAWSCDPAPAAGGMRLSSCSVRPYVRASGPRNEYLYWAFLNLAPGSRRGDLAARGPEMESFFDGLEKPLLAMKQRGDSCAYLVLFRESYAPLAAGRVACPDLVSGLAAIEADLAGRTGLAPRSKGEFVDKKVLRSGELSRDIPNHLDYGLETSASLAFGMSADHQEGEGPFAQQVSTFNFKDFADTETMPVSLRAFLLYRGIIGFRAGYSFSRYSMENDVLASLQQSFSAQGGSLTGWDISRHDVSFELMLGRTYAGESVELGWHGILGMVLVQFNETATVNGREYDDLGLLGDVTGFLIGGGGDLRFGRCVVLGVEMGLMLKDFKMRNVTTQPDGTGNELQIRLRLGGFMRKTFAGR